MPGMITTRSLLWEAVTAGWISWKRQRAYKRRLTRSRRVPAARLSLRSGAVGRSLKPLVSARRMDLRSRASEPDWQTTRVVPRACPFSADASERALGTAPPAAGLTDVSGLGSGQ